MWFWASTSSRARAVPGGRREPAVCCECQKETIFAEVEVTEELSLFSVFTVDEDKSTAFRCTGCGALGQLVDTHELPADALERLSPEIRRKIQIERAARAKRERAERAARERRKRAERAAAIAAREARADFELAALKKRMGLAPVPECTETDEDTPSAAEDRTSFWNRLRRRR